MKITTSRAAFVAAFFAMTALIGSTGCSKSEPEEDTASPGTGTQSSQPAKPGTGTRAQPVTAPLN